MHKNPYKHRFIAGSARCSTKPLSILLTKLITHFKQGLQKYFETAYTRSGVNQMWILKNSKELLEHLKSPNFNNITSIKSIDFSTLYTNIPHDKLKSRLANIIRNSFMFKNGNRRYKYLVLGHEESYFQKEHSDSKHKYSEDDINKMLEFLVDNIFVVFVGKVFQQIVGIPMGTNCAPLLADIFLYSYEAEFIQTLLSTGRKQLASRFNFTYRYIDYVLSINNPEFVNYLGQMYPVELEIKDTTESNNSASYLDLLLSIGRDGQLHTSIYDKSDDFNFHITNFPFLSSNIPTSPAYCVFISQLIRYARACFSYGCFILRATRLSNKLFEQGYVKERLKSSLRKFYGRYGDLIKQYEVSLSQMLNNILWPDHIQRQPPTDQTLYRTRPFTEFWVVSIEHLRRVWHADRGRLLLVLSHLGFANVLLLRPLTLNHTLHNQFMTLSLNWLLTELDSFSWIDTTNSWHFPWFDSTEYRFPWNICNGCGMPTGDAYSSGHLVPSLWDLHVLLVETNPFPNLSLFYRTMLFEYPSVLSRFCSAVLWKPPKFGNKVKISNKVQFGNKFANWYNVLSIEGVIVYGHVSECHVTFGRGRLHNIWWDPHIVHKTSWGTISNVPWHIPVRGA